MTRRCPIALLCLLGLIPAVSCGGDAAHPVDLLIVGALLLDGSGDVPREADVALVDGRIQAIGDLAHVEAQRTIDASGQVLAPGFVDMHSHADLILLADTARQQELLRAKIAQGVTTVVVGNCGLGVAPADTEAAGILSAVNGWMTPDGVATEAWTTGQYLERLDAGGVVLNVATLVPHGPLRISAMGLSPGAPDATRLAAMRERLERSLDEGAFGLSSGLIYPPGMFSDTDELVDLASVVARRDRLVTAHVRGSSEMLIPATEELIDIARRSGARVHHSHLEAVGRRFWPEIDRVLALEDAARAEGLALSHDVFVYTRAATMMSAIFPPWSLEGGVDRLLQRLQDPTDRARMRDELERRVPQWPPWQPGGWPHNLVGAVGWDGIRVASVATERSAGLVGRTLAGIAAERGQHPFDVVAQLMHDERGQVGQLVGEISGDDDEIERLLSILRHPAAAVVSDAEDYGRGAPHPAHSGAFARALRLSRERELMPLERLVQRMTAYPAELVGLGDRGRIAVGLPADLVVFDADRVMDRSTWDRPRRPAEAVSWVVINGNVAVESGTYVGGVHGHVLRAR
ncbi:MAG: amidohydrolase family protein [bacterium]|nr:amidohydrolase family protein [bacterium]